MTGIFKKFLTFSEKSTNYKNWLDEIPKNVYYDIVAPKRKGRFAENEAGF